MHDNVKRCLQKLILISVAIEAAMLGGFSMTSSNKNVNDVALIRHLATSNIANFMWYNFLLVKK